MSEINWSDSEKKAAKEVFDRAYEREINNLIEEVRQKASQVSEIDQLWQLHDFLSAKRHEIDGKYDYRYSELIFVFAKLLKQGWVNKEELKVLERDKLAKISALSRM